MSAVPDDQTVCIAFACFHFPPTLDGGGRFEASEYPAAVRKALEESPGIDNVEMRVDEAVLSWAGEFPGSPPSLTELGAPFPNMGHSQIRFDVRIPRRMQEELLGSDLYGIGTETFRVHLRYGYEMPVLAVQPLGDNEDARPSRAVILVREFLAREFERSRDGAVSFDFLGPSPAHSDFYLVPARRPEDCHEKFWLMEHSVRGYHHYRYGFQAEDFADSAEVVRCFLYESVSEFSLYYALAQEGCARMDAWGEIDRMVGELVAMQRRRGPAGFFLKTLFSSRKISNAQLALIEFQSREVMAGGELDRKFAKIYGQPDLIVARALVEGERADQFEYPTAEIAELLRLMDTRRLTDRDVLMLGLASVLGGALGALGGVLAS